MDDIGVQPLRRQQAAMNMWGRTIIPVKGKNIHKTQIKSTLVVSIKHQGVSEDEEG